MERIIVGVDGSDGGRAALRWAVAEAERWGASVVAVWAWEFSPLAFASEVPVQLTELGDAVSESLQQLLLEELGAEGAAEVEARVVQGPPSMVIVDLATAYDHVVVGSRGMGGFKGLLVGSVSQQVVHHAPCPVTVVRAPSDAAR